MKKLLSLVMAGAMVLSLVPATAFAKGEVTATAKVVDAIKKNKDFSGVIAGTDSPELQLKVTGVDYLTSYSVAPKLDVTVSLDNAEFTAVLDALSAASVKNVSALDPADLTALAGDLEDLVTYIPDDDNTMGASDWQIIIDESSIAKDEFKFTITGDGGTPEEFRLVKDDLFVIQLESTMTKTTNGTKATVSVDSKAVSVDDLVYCTIVDTGITASVKKTVDIAEDEVTTLSDKGIKIKTAVGNFNNPQYFELKLSSGFEFSKVKDGGDYEFDTINGNKVLMLYTGAGDEFTIEGGDIEIEATSAKSGAVATLTIKAIKTDFDGDAVSNTFSATASIEVAKVVDYKVSLTVDEDEDVPVIYSGVNVDNYGLTDDSDHWSLEVTAKESFPGAWSMRQGFNFNLPDGVYVTDVELVDHDNFLYSGDPATDTQWEDAFEKAYKDGGFKNFEFKKRVFDDVNTTLESDPAELSFKLQLVADPTFEGDVTLALEGGLLDTQSVTIAKFVKPYTVKAEQNDVIIDYRNTAIDTPIVITEAEAGLWAKEKAAFGFAIETGWIEFEADPTFGVDSSSDMELKSKKADKGTLTFTVKTESDSAATITISDMELFMNRSIPAGAYDLVVMTSMSGKYVDQAIYAAALDADTDDISDVSDYDDEDGVTVKEAFVNVVTAGVDKNNMFTTKVVVPVGESYLVAGSTKIELDAPAYISAAGYTMLPVRAVSKALGVDTNNVLWSAETRTVTIMYAQRIITMTVGQKTVYVNGSAIPTSAAPEITNGRTYLPLRDLGTALGVTNVNWDAATKTATLN
ncbi:hypothetical protein CLNEO_01590 [Anaerotignum neopropionicum]|uniref:Copper amine oxidase-like N-terminal domain-containing protein n=1 Tax=Anaerotignum neopropionicum TaxID=36847 RepID=A0A136WHZ4_9FIRM|nr:copper amine oxidase N-terminal domain-containing protein [Anaerotignum neopropionicum]KXL54063.1 hypothetical protein CLNEO_01590 [Anaerotignum neopropionicum]